MQLPGWWYRGRRQEYLGSWANPSGYGQDPPAPQRKEPDAPLPVRLSSGSPLRRATPYRALDARLAPAENLPQRRPYSSRPRYGMGRPRGYR
jgi:hypothetical protein